MAPSSNSQSDLLAEIAALRRENERLRNATVSAAGDNLSFREVVQAGNVIVLRWDLRGNVTFLNDFGLQFFGFEANQILGRPVVGTIVPVTDTSGRNLAQMINELLSDPDRYVSNENENMRKDGERVWITWRNRPLFDANGQPREILSIGIDSSERKRAIDSLRESEWRYRALFQSTPIAMVERDASALKQFLDELTAGGIDDVALHIREQPGLLAHCLNLVRVTALNAAAQALFETTSAEDLDRYAYVADSDDFTNLAYTILNDLATGAFASREREGIIRTPNGRERYVLARTTVVPGYEQTLARIVTAVIDVTDQRLAAEALRASEERFRDLSMHDNLTGLYNTRHLYQALGSLIPGDCEVCSVLFMDLDRFKHVVDTYGHLNGSRAIQEVAETIQSCIEPPAFAVAYAGDEFVIVLPCTPKSAAIELAARIQSRVGAHVFLAAEGYSVRISASLGVAAYPDDASNMDDLLAVADQALFGAKACGRNSILAAGEMAGDSRATLRST